MAAIDKLGSLLRKLDAKIAKMSEDKDKRVVVGYEAGYAVYVHEDLEALHGAAYNAAYIDTTTTKSGKPKHAWNEAAIAKGYNTPPARPRGENQQAKFLETPAREMRSELADIIRDELASGKTPMQALLVAGLALQASSQKIVPVDTGNLKQSAFTRLE